MSLFLLRRTSRFRPGDPEGLNWSVTLYEHDSDQLKDTVRTVKQDSDPGPFSADPTQSQGFYCRFTTRVDVYHSDKRDGTSRLESTVDQVACPVPPTPQPPDEGTISIGLENDHKAPPNAVLLRRICHPQPDNTWSYLDTYYDPAKREILQLVSDPGVYADSCTRFSMPTGQVFDRYCLAKGVAPYTERQVSWDLTRLVYKDVDGVTTCQLPACQLTLTATITPIDITGRGVVTLVPGNAIGGLVYRLVGSDLPDQESKEFKNLPAGRYTFEAQETRDNGCKARVVVVLKAEYGPRYRLRYKDARGRCCTLLFLQRGYTGPVEKIIGKPDAAIFDWPGGSLDHVHTTRLRGSECSMRLLLTYREQMLDTFSGDERYFRVEHYIEEVLFWRGYLLQEQYNVAFLAPPVEFSLAATDGLAALDGIPFAGPLGQRLTGNWTFLAIVQHCLGRTDLDLPLYVRSLLYPAGASTQMCALEQAMFDVQQYRDSNDVPWSCAKVLSAVLDVFQARLMQRDGAFWLERLADLNTIDLTYFAYTADGAAQGTITRNLLRSVTKPPQGYVEDDESSINLPPLYWVGAVQTKGLRGAVRVVTVNAKPGDELVNLLALEAKLDPAKVDSTGKPRGWFGNAPATLIGGSRKSDDVALLLPGVNGDSPVTADFLQTPLSSVSVATAMDVELMFPLQLKFTVTVRSAQVIPDGTPDAGLPTLYVGLKHGDKWLGAGDEFGYGAERLSFVRLPKLDDEIEVELGGYGRYTQESAQVAVRFLQISTPAGRAPYDVEIKNIRLNWLNLGFEEAYADQTTEESDLLITRTDVGQELFHTDTPRARFPGTVMNLKGFPTEKWFEPALASQLTTLHAYLVNDRFLWQIAPAQTLSGVLRGDLSPGSLLTDPVEQRPAVYVLTSARYNGPKATWEINAVQDRQLTAPIQMVPAGAIAYENLDIWLSEAGEIFVYEDAQ